VAAWVIDQPSKADIAAARRALAALDRREPVALGAEPASATMVSAIRSVLEALASGEGLAMVALDSELTLAEAAELIGITRGALIRLIESGVLSASARGDGRYLKARDVLAYRRNQDAERRSALDSLVAENQRLGLYED